MLGLGNWRCDRFCTPSLSSIPQPGRLVGFEALRVLDGLMAGQALPDHPILIETPPVVVRESTSRPDLPDERLWRAHEFIVEHACQGITTDDVLPLVQLSLPTFHQRFAALYGRTPGAEIRRVKLERAQYYLRTTTLSVARVAELCGYDDPANFTSFFSRESGQSPTAYRRQQAGKTTER